MYVNFVFLGKIVLVESSFLEGSGNQVVFCNFDFFFCDVAGKPDDFDSVEEGLRNGVEQVGGADEEDLGERRVLC